MLDTALQSPFADVFDRLLADATATARRAKYGPSEVHWVEQLHTLVATNLDRDLRTAIRRTSVRASIRVSSAFTHGNPFQIAPRAPVTKAVEAGDLVIVGDKYDDHGQLVERQALLLQMKVGRPAWSSPRASTAQQAALYSAWPPVEWQSAALRAFPGPHPRVPNPSPCRAAQFGVIPPYRMGGACLAVPLTSAGNLGADANLADEMAAVARLDIGVDATPRSRGWSRIVQDMLERAGVMTYASRTPRHSEHSARYSTSGSGGGFTAMPSGGAEPSGRGGFMAVVVATGGVGQLD